VERLKTESEGLGLFVRSLVGLEPQAAHEAMSKFLNDTNASQNQISFVRMIVEQLTYNGAMSKDRLYEAPFTDIAVAGPDSVFTPAKVIELFSVIDEIRQRAVA
jgi:type I restriction enzyme R subunit